MKVKLLAQISGTRNGVKWPAYGATVDLPEDEAKQMIANGVAEVSDEPAVNEPVVEVKPKAGKKK